MTRGWLSVAFVCAFGAFIGTLAALEISARFEYGSYLWSIGALFGGIVAYVTIDFRHFCAGVADSYRRTMAWKPDRLYWRAFFAQWVGMSAVTTTCCISIPVLYYVMRQFEPVTATVADLLTAMYYFLVWVAPAFSFTLGILIAKKSVSHRPRRYYPVQLSYEDFLRQQIEDGWFAALNFNPIAAIFWMIYGIVLALIHSPSFISDAATSCAATVVQAMAQLKKFVVGLFIYVHSTRRTICFVDATIGAAIGYSLGSAIYGAIAGAFLGVINYELVSVRWLKIVPASR
jgi:hypothetical protein